MFLRTDPMDTASPEPQIKKPRYVSNLPGEESENQDDDEIKIIEITPAKRGFFSLPVII